MPNDQTPQASVNSTGPDSDSSAAADSGQPPSSDACLWRLSVPQTAPVLNLQALGVTDRSYIEWHGAQRWVWAAASQADALRDLTHNAGGHAVLFRTSTLHGDADKAVGVFSPLDAVQQRIQDQLKKQFDPAGILNPGRI